MRVLSWLERGLLIAGAVALIWCAIFVGDALFAQRSARRSLDAVAVVDRPVGEPAPRRASDPVTAEPPARGAAIGTLSIPRVDLSAIVLHGSDAQTLRRGPGHLEHTALPGDPGNVVIAGHRDSFFWPLRNIQLGDDIFIDTRKGRIHYRVDSVRVVNPHDIGVLKATAEPVLTLITCYPFWVFGHAPDRFVVRATALVKPGGPNDDAGEAPSPVPIAVAPRDVPPLQQSDSDSAPVNDDRVLVRLAVERYRHMYNGRLISRNELGSTGVLTFTACDVTVAGDGATAVCDADASRTPGSESTTRTFMLERSPGGWAIRSIVVS